MAEYEKKVRQRLPAPRHALCHLCVLIWGYIQKSFAALPAAHEKSEEFYRLLGVYTKLLCSTPCFCLGFRLFSFCYTEYWGYMEKSSPALLGFARA